MFVIHWNWRWKKKTPPPKVPGILMLKSILHARLWNQYKIMILFIYSNLRWIFFFLVQMAHNVFIKYCRYVNQPNRHNNKRHLFHWTAIRISNIQQKRVVSRGNKPFASQVRINMKKITPEMEFIGWFQKNFFFHLWPLVESQSETNDYFKPN